MDLTAPSGINRDEFDHLHRLLDPSHVRTYSEEELVAEASAGARLSYVETSRHRFPIDVAISENSDADPVFASLGREVTGGRPTGFEPELQDGSFIVSFLNTIVQATCPFRAG